MLAVSFFNFSQSTEEPNRISEVYIAVSLTVTYFFKKIESLYFVKKFLLLYYYIWSFSSRATQCRSDYARFKNCFFSAVKTDHRQKRLLLYRKYRSLSKSVNSIP